MLLSFAVFFPLIAGLILLVLKNPATEWRWTIFATALTALSTILLVVVGYATVQLPLFSDFGIGLVTNNFTALYALLTALLWLLCTLASRDYLSESENHLHRYCVALLITLSGVLGVFLAADLFTLFVFFEVMSFASYLWVAHSQDDEASVASGSYLAFSVFGGLSILFGIFLLYSLCPDLAIANLTDSFSPYVGTAVHTAACLFLLVGFGIKAGAFLLYDWLPLSYTAAPAPATALLSGLLSKAGIYGILLILWRIASTSQVLALSVLVLALLNMLVGGFSALFSRNLKTTLAYSSVSQIGFILWGVALAALLGEHGDIALAGTLFHMVNHTLIKVLLFVLAGGIYQSTHDLSLEAIRGYGRDKPLLHVLFLIGAGSVAGIPLLSGYISKTLLHEAIVEYAALTGLPIFILLEYLFLLAGGCTLAYMLKLYLCLFWEKSPSSAPLQLSRGTQFGLCLVAGTLVALGTLPHLTFDYIATFTSDFTGVHNLGVVAYFSLGNLSGSAISIAMGLILFVLYRRYLQAYHTRALPTLALLVYRPARALLTLLGSLVARIFDVSTDMVLLVLRQVLFTPLSIPDSFYHGDPTYGKHQRTRIHITYSLAYSLLMFGMGFLFTIVALLCLGLRT